MEIIVLEHNYAPIVIVSTFEYAAVFSKCALCIQVRVLFACVILVCAKYLQHFCCVFDCHIV